MFKHKVIFTVAGVPDAATLNNKPLAEKAA